MFTCRKELEELLRLKHPRKVLIEESPEIPRPAERFFKGIYTDPEKLKRGLSDFQRETTSILELLGLRKNRFREWLAELPSSPLEAQEYLRETSVELKVRQERAALVEARVLAYLQEQEQVDMFPIEEEVLGKFNSERILLYPKVIDKVALLLKLPAENLNKVVLVHFMTHLLIYAAEDLDKRTWARHELSGDSLEALVHYYSGRFFQAYQYKELAEVEKALIRYLPGPERDTGELDSFTREQVNAAVIFWRRRPDISLRAILSNLSEFN